MSSDAAPGPRTVDLPDGAGAAAVLAAVGAARLADPDRPLDLVGYGSSGIAVLSLVLHQRRLGLVIGSATCINAVTDHDPISDAPLAPPTRPPHQPTRPTQVRIVTAATAAARSWAEHTAAAWRAAGWDVTLQESSG